MEKIKVKIEDKSDAFNIGIKVQQALRESGTDFETISSFCKAMYRCASPASALREAEKYVTVI